MKRVLTAAAMAAAVIVFPAAKSFAALPAIAPDHAHAVYDMQCQWIDDNTGEPFKNSEPQAFTVYEDWNKTQWLQIAPAKDAPKGWKPAPYIRTVEGGFGANNSYKDFYWQDSTTRMTVIRNADRTASIAVESIYSPSMPVVYATCHSVTYATP